MVAEGLACSMMLNVASPSELLEQL
jgi:hypothetical protein